MLDVLIAGAGPAGALAALRLARAGARVLLVDRARFPRDKLCGDTLNPGALRILARYGLDTEVHASGVALEGMLLTNDRGVQVRGRYGRGRVGRALTRRRFDERLVRAAAAAGAQVQDGVRVQGALVEERAGGRRVYGAVLTGRDGGALRVPAALTIACDGRRSTLAFGLGLARQPDTPRRWAIGAYFDGVEELSSLGEMHIRRGHYLGVAPMGDGLANVCLVTQRGAGFDDPARLLDRHVAADPVIGPRFAGARRISSATVIGPLAVDVSTAGAPGLLLAGDAAGFVDPMTGDGLRLALRGAELAAEAAEAALGAVGEGDAASVAHLRLAARRQRELGLKLRVNRLLRQLTSSSPAIGAAGLGALAAPFVLERVIRYAGDLNTP
jgi:geranylgeranyl reductase family protein